MLRKKWIGAVALLLMVGAYLLYRGGEAYEPADSQFTGAYRFSDRRLAVVTPSVPGRYRLRFFDGSAYFLVLTAGDRFECYAGFAASDAPRTTGRFLKNDAGRTIGLEWTSGESASRLGFEERYGRFRGGDESLRGKLVLPAGDAPHPVVVLVHGSEDYSAFDYYYLPYFLAAHGFAAVAFDKRGTGESTGKYTQDFETLAGDVAAAAKWAADDAAVDEERINLLGLSQGGWIAPLAAKQIPGVRALSIHYGVAVSVARKDRWGYVYELTKQGFGDAEIAKADVLNAVMSRILKSRDPEAWSELAELRETYGETEWFKAIAGSDSIMGRVAETSMPVWVWRAYFWFQPTISEQWDWDPRSTVASLDVPQHWILAGEDSSVPTPETVAVLDTLRAEGKPVDIRVFEDTDHGIVTYTQDEAGIRTRTGYAPSYFSETVAWLVSKNFSGP